MHCCNTTTHRDNVHLVTLIKFCSIGFVSFCIGLTLPLLTDWEEFIWIHLGFTFLGIGIGVYAISSYAQKIVDEQDCNSCNTPRQIAKGRRPTLVSNGRRGGLSIQWSSRSDFELKGESTFKLDDRWNMPRNYQSTLL